MGAHTGEASRTATGLVGLDVHRAARVAAAGHGGQVLVSEASAALVDEGLPPGAALTDLWVHRLEDLEAPVRIFQLSVAGLPAEFPPLRTVPGGAAAATRALRRDLVSAARGHAGQQPIAWGTPDAHNWRIWPPEADKSAAWSPARNRRSVIVRAKDNVPARHATRPRGACCGPL